MVEWYYSEKAFPSEFIKYFKIILENANFRTLSVMIVDSITTKIYKEYCYNVK